MAYEVTATRRRPQQFKDLVGQEFVAETFKNSIESGKIAHAYLFTGPRGCGKTSTARILAKALCCEKGPTATPCGVCTACQEIAKGSSLDVIEIDGASNNGVDSVRQIKDEVLFPPNSCRYKIYIIDEVHMLSTGAFNALLKTIEEPPPYAIFIFATTELQKVPATIKSRCQQFNFRLVPAEKVKEQLALAAQELGIKADDEALYWIAREAGGSMRDSYTLFDQVAAFSDGEITYDKIRDKLGLVGVDRLNEMFGLCVNGDRNSVLLKLDEYLQNGVSIEQLITNCTDYLRSILLIKSGVTKEALLGQDSGRFSKDVLGAWSNIQVERAISIFLQLYRDIRYSLSPRYEMELALSRLCWLKEYVSPAEVKRAVDAVRPVLLEASGSRTIESGSQTNARQPAAGQTTGHGAVQASVSSQPVHQTAGAQTGGMQSQSGYVPHFSALDEVVSNQTGQAAGQSHPFPDGGAVPPLKNTAAYCDDGEYEDGTYAPDDSDADSTLSDESVSDEARAQMAEEMEQKAEEDSSLLTENTENLDEAGKLRAELIKKFSSSETMCAAALSKSTRFTKEAGNVTAWVENSYEKMQLTNYASQITAALSEKLGGTTAFEVKIEEPKGESVKKELPPEVVILRDTFRGTVISGA